MKRAKLYTLFITVLLLVFSACNEDFLNRYPEDAMSDATFFTKASDFKTYVNGLYSGIIRNVSNNRWVNLENGSDNLFTESPHSSLMRHSISGAANETSGTWNGGYNNIREVNYVLNSKDKLSPRNEIADHYIGEAHFIRAWHYFDLLQAFGGVPYIDIVVGTDSPELFKVRDSRDFIASKILQDLDSAIALLNWKGSGEAKPPRINKESALLMKTRVALYEGSWEYYHGRKNTPFKVDGSDGTDFLNEVITAGDMLIDHQGTNIFQGPAGAEYSDLFNRDDYSNIPGAFLYKHYDVSLGVPSGETRATLLQYQAGLTKNAVFTYLMNDGKPEEISTIDFDYKDQNSLINSRDPRLYQTIYAPERGPFTETYDFISFENLFGSIYANLTNIWSGKGGFTIFKGTVFSTVTLDQNNTDDLIFRYGEALLNYAEAKAILGTITQNDIDNTVNVLRTRVGMVPLNLAEVNSWNVTYAPGEGYDPGAPNILNEIRRERRVELILEGFRTTDIKRWALYDDTFNGYKPVGAYYQELADYWNNPDNIIEAGFPESKIEDLKLIKGQNIDALGEYVNPFWQNSDFSPTGRGYYIDPGRDYLQAIPKKEIDFYREKGGVNLQQNPGWF